MWSGQELQEWLFCWFLLSYNSICQSVLLDPKTLRKSLNPSTTELYEWNHNFIFHQMNPEKNPSVLVLVLARKKTGGRKCSVKYNFLLSFLLSTHWVSEIGLLITIGNKHGPLCWSAGQNSFKIHHECSVERETLVWRQFASNQTL